jgi:hypothetical protein
MTVIKLSKSGRGFQVIADDGTVYQTSVYIARQLLDGAVNGGWVLLTQFPMKASADRFPKSPIYNPGNDVLTTDSDAKVSEDVFSPKYKQSSEQKIHLPD